MRSNLFGRGVGAAMAALVLAGTGTLAMTTTTTPAQAILSQYGCYKVVGASSLNVRKRAYSRSEVVGVISRGEVVGKWKRFCALRGFWCPVESSSGITGWADKRFLAEVSCLGQ